MAYDLQWEGFYQYPAVTGGGVNMTGTWLTSGESGSSFVAGYLAGTRALNVTASAGGGSTTLVHVWPHFAGPHTVGCIGFRFYVPQVEDTSRNNNYMQVHNSLGQTQYYFTISDLGELILNSAAGVELIRSDRVLVPGAYSFVELRYDVQDVTGRLSLTIDGETQLDYVGDTNFQAQADIERVVLRSTRSIGGVLQVYGQRYQDIYWLAGEYVKLGDSRVYHRLMEADETVQFTPLAGTNHEMVDESACDGDATYNSSSTIGHRDVFTVQNLDFVPSAIHGVEVFVAARKDDVADREIKYGFRNDSVDFGEKNYFLASTYTFTHKYTNKHPVTGVAWTPSEINSLRAFYELVS